ncbi:MAG: PfkB family carbohydrate kinase [Mycobacteriales bacterium]
MNILIVNETELALLTGNVLSVETWEADLSEAASRLGGMGLHGSLVVTLGARGAVALADGEVFVVAGHRVPAVDTTGAGDCFVGCLAAELTRDATLSAALRYANAASALAVQTPGAGSAMPSHEQVEKFIRS